MEVDREDGRTPNQLRPLACSYSLLNRAHGSARWSQGDSIVLAAVYGPKAGTKKNENPEKASIEVIWKPKTGQIGQEEKEYEMILRRTLQSICLLTVNPNTTTSIILQVVNDDGGLLPCAINAACAALVDAGIPLKHLAVSVCCGLTESESVILDPTKSEEQLKTTYVALSEGVLQVRHYQIFFGEACSLRCRRTRIRPNKYFTVYPEKRKKKKSKKEQKTMYYFVTSFINSSPMVMRLACNFGCSLILLLEACRLLF